MRLHGPIPRTRHGKVLLFIFLYADATLRYVAEAVRVNLLIVSFPCYRRIFRVEDKGELGPYV
jgi:hypothetical protein